MPEAVESCNCRDENRQALMKAIEEKIVSGGKARVLHQGLGATPTKIVNIAKILQTSVAEKRASGKRKKPKKKRPTPA